MPVEYQAQGFEYWVQKLCTIFNVAAACLLFILMVLGAADVLGRYFLNAPINGTMEAGQILLALMVFLSWGQTQIKKDHVNVSLFVSRFPPRLQKIAELITTLLSLLLFLFIIWRSYITAMDSFDTGEQVYVLRWPLAPFQLLVPIGGIFLCLVLLLDLVRCVQKIRGSK